jgi:hypothetical protein
VAFLAYLLCAATSATCSLLLLLAFHRSGTQLLWWSGVCFALLSVNNLLILVDLVVFPNADLFAVRNATALLGLSLLLYGLIWESD